MGMNTDGCVGVYVRGWRCMLKGDNAVTPGETTLPMTVGFFITHYTPNLVTLFILVLLLLSFDSGNNHVGYCDDIGHSCCSSCGIGTVAYITNNNNMSIVVLGNMIQLLFPSYSLSPPPSLPPNTLSTVVK